MAQLVWTDNSRHSSQGLEVEDRSTLLVATTTVALVNCQPSPRWRPQDDGGKSWGRMRVRYRWYCATALGLLDY